jgi:hypothetical protein
MSAAGLPVQGQPTLILTHFSHFPPCTLTPARCQVLRYHSVTTTQVPLRCHAAGRA